MDIYAHILQELEEEGKDLQRKIYQLLKDHPGGLTRHEMIFKLYGYIPTDINNDKNDRKIRKAIEFLRNRMFPIVSDSGRAGYRLDTSREAVRRMVDQLQAKRQKLSNLIRSAALFYDIPEYIEPVEVKQMELI